MVGHMTAMYVLRDEVLLVIHGIEMWLVFGTSILAVVTLKD